MAPSKELGQPSRTAVADAVVAKDERPQHTLCRNGLANGLCVDGQQTVMAQVQMPEGGAITQDVRERANTPRVELRSREHELFVGHTRGATRASPPTHLPVTPRTHHDRRRARAVRNRLDLATPSAVRVGGDFFHGQSHGNLLSLRLHLLTKLHHSAAPSVGERRIDVMLRRLQYAEDVPRTTIMLHLPGFPSAPLDRPRLRSAL